jgi:hypothetical protein
MLQSYGAASDIRRMVLSVGSGCLHVGAWCHGMRPQMLIESAIHCTVGACRFFDMTRK